MLFKKFEEFLQEAKVLIVDDSPTARTAIKLAIQDLVGEIQEAEDGNKGIDKLKLFRADLVISDINMPNTDGLMMSAIIKAYFPNIPIVLVTSFGCETKLQQAIEIGVDGYIAKPFKDEVLVKTLKKALTISYQQYNEKVQESIQMAEIIVEAKNEVLQDISHHWRNPLGAVGAYLQSNLEDLEYELDEKSIKNIKKGEQKSLDIIQNLSKTIDGFQHCFYNRRKKEIFKVEQTLESIKYMFVEKCAQNDISINFKHTTTFNLTMDRGAFSVAIYNMLQNSYEALLDSKKENKKIKILLFEEENKTKITITDNGSGIDSTIETKIFDPYFSKKSVAAGKGMGLFMSKVILEKNGIAHLSLNENSNKKTKFMIEFN